ncbi:hypothetical protein [Luteibaculum oceani]|uniref:DUF4296 domain-containing protein n=1 Tax=Luteibaculum oceani TaxID=1294296 RepID=A0A5C6V5I3_9FLAO|nr:hypothetical protein [Luteibaculum oceani]TXC78895.1 hypothetical protein FRX97_06690 [Luteibaculum oceani]
MRVLIIFLGFVAAFAVACSSNAPQDNKSKQTQKIPKIHDTTWVNLITELYFAEALKNKRQVAKKNIVDEVRWMDSTIVAHYGLTPKEFEMAYVALGRDFQRIERIYDQCLEKLSRLEARIKSDSLKTYDFPKDLR